MGLNTVVSAERLHISFFGRCNAGKSSLVNAVTSQQLAVVSAVRGTTTDPVRKAMELLPLGPVVMIDTPGLDDASELGELRVKKTKQVLAQTDIAVLVIDSTLGRSNEDNEIEEQLKMRKLPYIVVYNKADLISDRPELDGNAVYASAASGEGIEQIKDALGKLAVTQKKQKFLIADYLEPGDLVMLVTPIDESAPKGRLILPQQLTIREILDAHGIVITCQDTEVKQTLASLARKPKIVITDSQAFKRVSADVPEDIMLTSFSILMARYKGELKTLVRGANALSGLVDGDRVLISEGCTHHRQCNDIGTVKIPRWIEGFTNAKPEYHFTSGGEFPEELTKYTLVVHCGGCMLNEAEMKNRINRCEEAGVPIVNYGVAIAQMHGILKRSLQVFADELAGII